MPAPDPDALEVVDDGPNRVTVHIGVFRSGNKKARIQRGKAVFRNLIRGGWLCRWCRDPVPIYKRADAQFCCEGCRKRAARDRRCRRWR